MTLSGAIKRAAAKDDAGVRAGIAAERRPGGPHHKFIAACEETVEL